ncbi:MAG: LamG domain-containing protein [Singulisphaera sp.]
MSSTHAASFSGGNYLAIANYTGNPAAFSVSCWVYLNASQQSRMFFSNVKESEGAGWGVGISDVNADRLRLYLGTNTLETPTTLANLTWYHCVFTYDGTVARSYLDGNTTPIGSLTSAARFMRVPRPRGSARSSTMPR